MPLNNFWIVLYNVLYNCSQCHLFPVRIFLWIFQQRIRALYQWVRTIYKFFLVMGPRECRYFFLLSFFCSQHRCLRLWVPCVHLFLKHFTLPQIYICRVSESNFSKNSTKLFLTRNRFKKSFLYNFAYLWHCLEARNMKTLVFRPRSINPSLLSMSST